MWCATDGCVAPGERLLALEWGDAPDLSTVLVTLCGPHYDAALAWWSDARPVSVEVREVPGP